MVSLLRDGVRAPVPARPTGKCEVVTWLHFAVWGAGDGADGCGGPVSFLRRLDGLLRTGEGVEDQGNGRGGEPQWDGGGDDYGADESGGGGAAEEEVACEVHGYDCGFAVYLFIRFALLASAENRGI